MRGQAWSLAAATTGGEVVLGRWGGYRRLLAAGLLLLALALVPLLERAATPATAPGAPEILDRLAAAPVGFVENAGQAHSSATHVAQGPGYAFTFGRDGVRVALGDSLSLGLAFLGANRAAEAELAGRPSGSADYLVGARSRWRTGLATYPALVYRELWPGVDMAFSGSGGRLKYEFRLAPGADPSRIRLAYQGAQSLSLSSAGALNIHTGRGVLRDAAPVSYQRIDGRRVPVESSFAVDGHAYGFALGAYDQSRPLVIDPGLEYSTYLGGAADDSGFRIDVKGPDAYVTGGTASADFPVTRKAFDKSFNGGAAPTPTDAFVVRLDTSKRRGAALEYSSFLGGTGNDFGISIDVRRKVAYVTGQTASTDFPVTSDARQSTNAGEQDAFVSLLDTRKGRRGLDYSTYLGGASNDRGFEIVAKGAEAYLTGVTFSSNFPVTGNAYDQSFNGGPPVPSDAFVTRLDTGRRGAAGLEYSTYLGGNNQDAGRGIAVRRSDVYLTGLTGAADFPVTGNAYDRTFNGGGPPFPVDAFVTRLDIGRGTAGLEYSTYLGGDGNDVGFSMEAKRHGAYVAGEAGSNFPVTGNALDTSFGGGGPCSPPPVATAACDAFVTWIDTRRAGAAGLEYSTYLGGSGGDIGRDLAVRGRNAFATGVTASTDFPVTRNAFQRTKAGAPTGPTSQDAFVTRLDTDSARRAGLDYSTYLGGSDADEGFGIALNGFEAFVTGPTSSPDFPVKPRAIQKANAGGQDAYVARIDTKRKRRR